ncbi:MAG: protein-glutamate O-methyltransferase CheR [Methylomonas sp.]|nr:protein-glutamate O-methyltransferase CheR [Methylomonas sp.]
MKEKEREFEYTLEDFNFLRRISNQHSGILVPDDKFDMFYSRLSKRVRLLGFNRFKQYCDYLQSHQDQEFTEFINAVTTNLTSFFRESHHFEYLSQVLLPELVEKNRGRRQIRGWSAGCSTGEEPYSIAMTLLENVPAGWDVKLLATDLDTNVLKAAAEGVYPVDRIGTIGEPRLHRWFQRGVGSQHNKVRVKAELRGIIHFNQLNLMQDWPMRGPFDFIFCRNVLIYFDKETKTRLVSRYAGLLREKGLLFIGHSESLHQTDTPFSLIRNTIYQKTTI